MDHYDQNHDLNLLLFRMTRRSCTPATTMMIFTIFTPTYNRGHSLHRVYHSLCQQTFADFEWIIVDDGSSDKTWDVLRTLGFSDSKEERNSLRYIFQKNKGVSAARNLGIKAAKYRYIAFLDSDDLWLEKKLYLK